MVAEGQTRSAHLVVLVAALGYFVDIYDLILFSIVRVRSLAGIAVPAAEQLEVGVRLLNAQMLGMLAGGVLWGVLGDKRGRLSVLFGSILLYSSANIVNGLIHTPDAYAACRFMAGIGLAGELGAGITLVSELMHRQKRGYGTTIVATVGICGGMVAFFIGDLFDWRVAYFVGGGLGLALLLLRLGVYESTMFEAIRAQQDVARGALGMLFATPRQAFKYLSVILIGVPIWYVVGILITFSPEIGRAMHMDPAPDAGKAVLYTYFGLAFGDLASGVLSQWFKSRKQIVGAFMALTALAGGLYFVVGAQSLATFNAVCVALGVATGYWAVFVTIASEQFGTNLRSTVTTTAPNFVRGAVVPMTLAFRHLQGSYGAVGAAIAVGAVVFVLAVAALLNLEETYGRDLNFLER